MQQSCLGILGGMGPLAGATFLARLTLLTPATRDQDHLAAVLWSDPRIPDRTAARTAGGTDPLPALMRGIRGLEAAGCGAIAIPCNTAHGWYDGMTREARVPILHIVEATANELLRLDARAGRIGLLATRGTLAMRLYQDRLEARGYGCIIPEPEEMERLVMAGIGHVKGNRLGEARAPLMEAARLLVGRGADAVVLGCTEIPLAISAENDTAALGVPIADSIDALARAAIAWAGLPSHAAA